MKTACILCSQNCGIEVDLDGRHLVRIRGDRAQPASQGYLCEKAQRLDAYQNARDRLTSPLRRRADGTFEAIDWASLTDDPLGVDGGCSVGSCTTWGPDYALVVRHERELFEMYLAGLRSSGWQFDPRDVRRAAFGQLGHYLLNLMTMPVMVVDGMHRAFLEKRFGLQLEEIPERGAVAIDMMPSYIEELQDLLA